MSATLTHAQTRFLRAIVDSPGKRYNGRARRPLEALEARGLITYTFDLRIHADGSSAQVWECYPTDKGREVMS